jgi:transcription elongation GreA/GreB family factor
MDKSRVVAAVVDKLQSELAVLLAAAKASHEAATGEESRAEDKHDTRATEASYLAGAQLARVGELQQQLLLYKHLDPKPMRVAAAGALVELESAGRRSFILLMAQGGGISVSFDGKSIQVISPQSPLGDELLGRRQGEEFEVETGPAVREYKVVSVF